MSRSGNITSYMAYHAKSIRSWMGWGGLLMLAAAFAINLGLVISPTIVGVEPYQVPLALQGIVIKAYSELYLAIYADFVVMIVGLQFGAFWQNGLYGQIIGQTNSFAKVFYYQWIYLLTWVPILMILVTFGGLFVCKFVHPEYIELALNSVMVQDALAYLPSLMGKGLIMLALVNYFRNVWGVAIYGVGLWAESIIKGLNQDFGYWLPLNILGQVHHATWMTSRALWAYAAYILIFSAILYIACNRLASRIITDKAIA